MSIKLRRLFLIPALLASAAAFAQSPPSQADIERMLQGAQAMQQCMAKIDAGAIERLGARGEKMQAEIDSLCAAGKRAEAQARAIEYGAEFMKDPAAKAMKVCTEHSKGMMQAPPLMDFGEGEADRHICDE